MRNLFNLTKKRKLALFLFAFVTMIGGFFPPLSYAQTAPAGNNSWSQPNFFTPPNTSQGFQLNSPLLNFGNNNSSNPWGQFTLPNNQLSLPGTVSPTSPTNPAENTSTPTTETTNTEAAASPETDTSSTAVVSNKRCLPSTYYMEADGCYFCTLFTTFFNAASKATYLAISTFSGSVFKVVIIGFAIWIALQTLAFVSSPETRDARDFVQAILVQGFIVALVCIILNGNTMSFMNMFLEPVYNTGLNIAEATLSPHSLEPEKKAEEGTEGEQAAQSAENDAQTQAKEKVAAGANASANSQQTPASTPATPSGQQEYPLGSLVSKFESGGNPGAVGMCGTVDAGGCSYGLYQMTSKYKGKPGGTVERFVNWCAKNPKYKHFADDLNRAGGAKSAIYGKSFATAWKRLAADPDFATAQSAFMVSSMQPSLKNLNLPGLNLESRSPVLTDAMLAVFTMTGNLKDVNAAFKGKGDLSKYSDEQLLKILYDTRIARHRSNYSSYCSGKRGKQGIQICNSVYDRVHREAAAALQAVNGNYAALSFGSGFGYSSSISLRPPATCEEDYGLYSDTTEIKGGLPPSMGNSILCTMTMVDDRATKIKALGSGAICASWENRAFIIPHLGLLFTGLGLWIGAVVLIVGVPFLMLDVVIELAIAGSLLPVAIGAAAFKSTRRYTKNVWETFLNSMFTFLFMSLVVLMLTTALEQIILDGSGSLDDLITSGEEAVITDVFTRFPWFSTAFLKVVFVLVLIWTMAGEARGFAGEFSSSISNTQFGSHIGTMGLSFAKGVGARVGSGVWNATKFTAKSAAKSVGSGAVHIVRRARLNAQVARATSRGVAVQNADGSTTYTYSSPSKWWRLGRSKTVQATIGADGSKNFRKEKTSRSGNKVWVKEKNEYFSVSQKYKRDKETGEMQKSGGDRIRYNSNAHKYLFNHKNQFDQRLFNDMMGNSNESQQIALMKTVVSRQLTDCPINLKQNDFISHELIRDDNGNTVGYREILKDGRVTEMRFSTNDKKRMKIDFTVFDESGKETKLSTDGILNKKQISIGTIKKDNKGNIIGLEKTQKPKTSYNLTSAYEKYRKQRRFRKIAYDESMFSKDEIAEAQAQMSDWWKNKKKTRSS